MGKYLQTLDLSFFTRKVDMGESIRQHIVYLLQVLKGSVRCETEYGVGLDFTLFSPLDFGSAEEIKINLTESILHADKRIKPYQLEITVVPLRDQSLVDIEILLHLEKAREERFNIRISQGNIKLVPGGTYG